MGIIERLSHLILPPSHSVVISTATWMIILCFFLQDARALEPSRHWSITYAAARNAHFSVSASRIIADGATAPDEFDWNTPAAHAQTPNDSQGLPILSVAAATQAFERYSQEKAAEMDSAIAGEDYGLALYRLGYTLHEVQDLSAHMGMTNAYHAYLSSIGENPDDKPASIARAQLWTGDFLDAAATRTGSRWQMLLNYEGPPPSQDDMSLSSSHGVEADRTLAALIRYRWLLPHPSKDLIFSQLWGGKDQLEALFKSTNKAFARFPPSPDETAGGSKLSTIQGEHDALYAAWMNADGQRVSCQKQQQPCFTPCLSMPTPQADSCNNACSHMCDGAVANWQKTMDAVQSFDAANHCVLGTCYIPKP